MNAFKEVSSLFLKLALFKLNLKKKYQLEFNIVASSVSRTEV